MLVSLESMKPLGGTVFCSVSMKMRSWLTIMLPTVLSEYTYVLSH